MTTQTRVERRRCRECIVEVLVGKPREQRRGRASFTIDEIQRESAERFSVREIAQTLADLEAAGAVEVLKLPRRYRFRTANRIACADCGGSGESAAPCSMDPGAAERCPACDGSGYAGAER